VRPKRGLPPYHCFVCGKQHSVPHVIIDPKIKYKKSILLPTLFYTFLHKMMYMLVWFMVFNTTSNNISLISWWSVLLVEETGVPRENHQPAASHWNLYHIMLYQTQLAWAGFKLATLVVIGTDYTGSCKSNYHTITATMHSPTLFYTSEEFFGVTNELIIL
jgi:hypothetical protein